MSVSQIHRTFGQEGLGMQVTVWLFNVALKAPVVEEKQRMIGSITCQSVLPAYRK